MREPGNFRRASGDYGASDNAADTSRPHPAFTSVINAATPGPRVTSERDEPRMKCTLGTSILIGCCLQLLLLYADALPPFITPEILEMVQSDKKRCMTEHGTTEAMIDNVNSGNMPNDRSITCYMYCMFEAFGMVDEEANVDIDIILTFIPEEYHKNSLETFNACNVKTDVTDVCDKLYELGSCILNKAPEMWFMV